MNSFGLCRDGFHIALNICASGHLAASATTISSFAKRSSLLRTLAREAKRSIHTLLDELRHVSWRRKRQSTIDAYMSAGTQRKLHIGCGPMIMDGWLNTDMEPVEQSKVIYLDIRETLPVPDESFDFIYSEHVIEHVSLEDGLRHLRDCKRVLRPGGVLRVATPDLKFLLDYFNAAPHSEVQTAFLAEIIQQFHPTLPLRQPAILLNEFVRDWGHLFIYDEDVLLDTLRLAGFENLAVCEVSHSTHSELRNLERHGSAITDKFNELQTMVIEAQK